MLRKLLTLLALMTGLAALAGPMESRAACAGEARVLAVVDYKEIVVTAQAGDLEKRELAGFSRVEQGFNQIAGQPPTRRPKAVHLRIDRARE